MSTVIVRRMTKETRVEAELDLDGTGRYDVSTDNPFLTHMLETWTRYAGFDLRLRATGDLDHHLVEDVAIVLGQAFREAFAQSPCQRIAYDFVPMDDALVLCAVDLVDRPFYSGELPIPLYEHWFRSFAMEARINLHLERLRGRDTHHTIEASFKAFARALRQALTPRTAEISTKGVAKVRKGAVPQRAAAGKPTSVSGGATGGVPFSADEAPFDVNEALQPTPKARRESMVRASREVRGRIEEGHSKEYRAARSRAGRSPKAAAARAKSTSSESKRAAETRANPTSPATQPGTAAQAKSSPRTTQPGTTAQAKPATRPTNRGAAKKTKPTSRETKLRTEKSPPASAGKRRRA